jgi:hypothetical protein
MLSSASEQVPGLRWPRSFLHGLQVFARDVGNGMLEVSHNLLALVGLAVVAVGIFLAGHADVRGHIESRAFGWLQDRHESRQPPAQLLAQTLSEPDAVERATAIDPTTLDRQQKLVAQWLSRRYRVAAEPVGRLVQEAWSLGAKAGLEPHLILAIMAIESSFNPFAQSSVGAQGLMQVMTRVHDDKFEAFGGTLAAFDPVANLRVGVQILRDCVARAGSLEGGLRFYVGAANLPDDGGYAARVLAERDHLKKVAQGQTVPFNAPLTIAQSPPAAALPSPIAATAATSVVAVSMPATTARPGMVAGVAVPLAAHPFDAVAQQGPAVASTAPASAAAVAVPTHSAATSSSEVVAPAAARPAPQALPAMAPASVPTAAEAAPARVAGL